MATNPQYPNEKRPELVKSGEPAPKLQVPPKKQFPWMILALIVAAAILAAIIAWMPRAPHTSAPPIAAEVPQQPTGNQIQFTDLKIQPAPTGGAFYLVGVLHNQGKDVITGAEVQAGFKDANGQTLETQTQPVEGLKNPPSDVEDLTKVPVKPNDWRAFRIYFEHPPAGWNKQMPELKITAVTGTPS